MTFSTALDIQSSMSKSIYPLRLSPVERREFGSVAKAEGKSLAEWLRTLGRERVKRHTRRAACLDYPDSVQLSAEAEANPKAFIRQKMEAKRELYR